MSDTSNKELQEFLREKKSLLEQKEKIEKELFDISHFILKYEVRHSVKVSSLVLKILNLKTQIKALEVKEFPNDSIIKEQYEQAQKDEDLYDDSLDIVVQKSYKELSEQQESELKTKFRKIAFLVHDDHVHQNFAPNAVDIFIKAKNAKNLKDIDTINQLFEYLSVEDPFPAKGEILSNIEIVKREIKHLYFQVELMAKDLIIIKRTEPYLTIAEITDWDSYFDEITTKLVIELDELQKIIDERSPRRP